MRIQVPIQGKAESPRRTIRTPQNMTRGLKATHGLQARSLISAVFALIKDIGTGRATRTKEAKKETHRTHLILLKDAFLTTRLRHHLIKKVGVGKATARTPRPSTTSARERPRTTRNSTFDQFKKAKLQMTISPTEAQHWMASHVKFLLMEP